MIKMTLDNRSVIWSLTDISMATSLSRTLTSMLYWLMFAFRRQETTVSSVPPFFVSSGFQSRVWTVEQRLEKRRWSPCLPVPKSVLSDTSLSRHCIQQNFTSALKPLITGIGMASVCKICCFNELQNPSFEHQMDQF